MNNGQWILGCSNSNDWGTESKFNTKSEAVSHGTLLLKLYNANPTSMPNRDRLLDDMGISPQDNEPIFEFEVGQLDQPDFPNRTDDLLELISQDVYDTFGDWAEDYLDDVDHKHQSELQELIRDWAERHDYLPNYFTIPRTETIDIRDVEGKE